MLGPAPVVAGHEAEEAAVNGIVHGAVRNGVQAFFQHSAEKGFAGDAIAVEQEAEHRGGGELGGDAKAAVAGVIGSGDAAGDLVHQGGVGFAAGGDAGGVFAALAEDVVGLLVEFGFAVGVGTAHFVQHRQELVGGQVGGAGDVAAVGSEEGGGGPAAHVVAGVDVGAVVGVDPHGDEVFVDEAGHLGVAVSMGVHFVAPVAPHGVDGEDNRPVGGLGGGEGRRTPGAPGDGGGRIWWRDAHGFAVLLLVVADDDGARPAVVMHTEMAQERPAEQRVERMPVSPDMHAGEWPCDGKIQFRDVYLRPVVIGFNYPADSQYRPSADHRQIQRHRQFQVNATFCGPGIDQSQIPIWWQIRPSADARLEVAVNADFYGNGRAAPRQLVRAAEAAADSRHTLSVSCGPHTAAVSPGARRPAG